MPVPFGAELFDRGRDRVATSRHVVFAVEGHARANGDVPPRPLLDEPDVVEILAAVGAGHPARGQLAAARDRAVGVLRGRRQGQGKRNECQWNCTHGIPRIAE